MFNYGNMNPINGLLNIRLRTLVFKFCITSCIFEIANHLITNLYMA
jgi:hypothetical protein